MGVGVRVRRRRQGPRGGNWGRGALRGRTGDGCDGCDGCEGWDLI